jgi:hypothetical protein
MNKDFWRRVLRKFLEYECTEYICHASSEFAAKWGYNIYESAEKEEFRAFCRKNTQGLVPDHLIGSYSVLFAINDREPRIAFLKKMIEISDE